MSSETSNPQESAEPKAPEESAIEKVSSQTQDLVKKNMPDESDEVKQKTMELIEAIKKRAQSEAKAADNWTRDTYPSSVTFRNSDEIPSLLTVRSFEKLAAR